MAKSGRKWQDFENELERLKTRNQQSQMDFLGVAPFQGDGGADTTGRAGGLTNLTKLRPVAPAGQFPGQVYIRSFYRQPRQTLEPFGGTVTASELGPFGKQASRALFLDSRDYDHLDSMRTSPKRGRSFSNK